MRGGEKVLLALARMFPQAPIFTLLHVKGSVAPELESREIHTTFVQWLPEVERRYRQYLPLFPVAAATIDLAGFDLVISSSHCVAKGVAAPRGALHLCYCHTPMRYVWDRYPDYFGPGRLEGLARMAVPVIAEGLRGWDVATASRVDHYAANSRYVAARIARYYGRDAEVIPPPVDTAFFTPGADTAGEYDLVVSALAPYKRLDLVLEAYRDTGRRLLIAGQRTGRAGPARGPSPRGGAFGPGGRRAPARVVPGLPGRGHGRGGGLRHRAPGGHGLRTAGRGPGRGRRPSKRWSRAAPACSSRRRGFPTCARPWLRSTGRCLIELHFEPRLKHTAPRSSLGACGRSSSGPRGGGGAHLSTPAWSSSTPASWPASSSWRTSAPPAWPGSWPTSCASTRSW